MSFSPLPGDVITVGGRQLSVEQHPAAPGVAFGQEGRTATVYKLRSLSGGFAALKVFKTRYRAPESVALTELLRPYAMLPGLSVCRRDVLTPDRDRQLLTQFPDLTYAVCMPWVEGQAWSNVVSLRETVTRSDSLRMAIALATVLTRLEQHGVAHCDISGPNVILPRPVSRLPGSGRQVELVDVDQLCAPGFPMPEAMPGGSPGYSVAGDARQTWCRQGDRFAAAIMLSEMLCWYLPHIRDAAWGESYFSPGELQQPCTRFEVLRQALQYAWGAGVAHLLEAAWVSTELRACPAAGEWLVALPQSAPAARVPANVAVPTGRSLQPATQRTSRSASPGEPLGNLSRQAPGGIRDQVDQQPGAAGGPGSDLGRALAVVAGGGAAAVLLIVFVLLMVNVLRADGSSRARAGRTPGGTSGGLWRGGLTPGGPALAEPGEGTLAAISSPVLFREDQRQEFQPLASGATVRVQPGGNTVVGELGRAVISWPGYVTTELMASADVLVSLALPSEQRMVLDQSKGTVSYVLPGDGQAADFSVVAQWATVEVRRGSARFLVSVENTADEAIEVVVVEGSVGVVVDDSMIDLLAGEGVRLEPGSSVLTAVSVDLDDVWSWYESTVAGHGEGVLRVVGSRGEDSTSKAPTAAVDPPTAALRVSSTDIELGDCVDLSWSASNAVAAQLDGSAVDTAGETTVCPEAETLYVLEVVARDGRSARDSVRVRVRVPVMTVAFSSGDAVIALGECTRLAWQTENSERVSLDGEPVDGSGHRDVCPTSDTEYTLEAVGRDGTVESRSVTVSVELQAEPLIKFWADAATIEFGECTSLRWRTENIDRVYLDGTGVIGDDSLEVCPSSTTTYHLEAYLRDGSTVTQEVTVEVQFSEPIVEFWADNRHIDGGDCTTIRWRCIHIREVYFEGRGVVGESSERVCPRSTRTYGLRVVHRDGSTEHRSLEVVVRSEGRSPHATSEPPTTVAPRPPTAAHSMPTQKPHTPPAASSTPIPVPSSAPTRMPVPTAFPLPPAPPLSLGCLPVVSGAVRFRRVSMEDICHTK